MNANIRPHLVTQNAAFVAGFADPSLQAQAAFRRLLDAWARPGQLADFGDLLQDAPIGFDAASAVLALTLVDPDTTIWLSPNTSSAADWLRFHCNAPIMSDPREAAFAFAQARELENLDLFNPGDALRPDHGATVIVQNTDFENGSVTTLEGPGVKARAHIRPSDLAPAFWKARAGLGGLYPAGIDLVLTSKAQAICVPRTSKTSLEG